MDPLEFKKYWKLTPFDDDHAPDPEFEEWWSGVIKAADESHREARRAEAENRERRDATLAKLANAQPLTEARALPSGDLAASDFLTFPDSMTLEEIVEALRVLNLSEAQRIDQLLMQGRWQQSEIARALGTNAPRVHNRSKALKQRSEFDPNLAKILPESVRRPGALRNRVRVRRGER